jgi:signal transduction protein with GAF and PtsI domain
VHRVVFRTLDVGADKPLPFVKRDPEENPALGLRGIRLGLQQLACSRISSARSFEQRGRFPARTRVVSR